VAKRSEERGVVTPPVNDNDQPGDQSEIKSPYVCIIARAIGSHMARQHYLAWQKKQRQPANDNSPATLEEEIKGHGPKG